MRFDYGVASLVGSATLQAIAEVPNVIPTEYTGYEHLSVTGLLVVAVIYLYRRVEGASKESKDFMEKQALEFRTTVEGHARSIEDMTLSLNKLTESNRSQTEIYLRYIDNALAEASKLKPHRKGTNE